jgi:type I restriction enzyme S subunit
MQMSKFTTHKLEEIADVQTGPFGSQLHMSDYKKEGTPIITVEHLGENRIIHKNLPLVGNEDKNRLKKYILKEGDIVFSRVGSVDRCAYVSAKENDWMFSGRCLRVRTNDKVDSRFLSFYFNQESFKEYIRMIAVGATMPSINTTILSEVEIVLPPLKEQKVIAEILSSLDDKIFLLQRQNATLEQLAESIFRQYFIEEAEDIWEIGILSDEFDFTMGQSPLGADLNESRNGIIFYQGRSDFGFRFPTPRVYTTAPTRIAKPFDTLISVRAPVGDMNMAFEECCLGRGVAAFRYKKNNEYYSYTYYKLRSLMEQIKQFEDNGSVFGSIGKDDFRKLENIIPPDNLVEKFQNVVKPIDDKIFLNTSQILKLTHIRNTILPKLINGEAELKN